MKKNISTIYKKFSLVFISIIFSLIIAEVFLRISKIGYGNAPLERSFLFDHTHPKNYSFLMYDPNKEYGGFQVYYDEKGYRVFQPGNSNFLSKNTNKSIVFLGDSFTEGNQVTYDETFVNKIEKTLKVDTLNLGVSSYSPLIYLIQAKKEISKLKSDLVVMQIYYNDFTDDFLYSKKAEYSNGEIIGINGGKNNLIITFLRKIYLARFIKKSQLLVKATIYSIKTKSIKKNSVISEPPHYFNITNNKFNYTVKNIIQIQSELKKMNKKIAVFMIPPEFLIKNGNCCARDKVYNDFKLEMNKNKIIFLDVSSYLTNYPNHKELFFFKDIHLTKKGHAFIAKSLVNELKAHSLIK